MKFKIIDAVWAFLALGASIPKGINATYVFCIFGAITCLILGWTTK